MPRNTVINRRNIGGSLKSKSMFVSEQAVIEINKLAERLMVSQGSLTDTALRYLATLPEAQVIKLMCKFEHLTQEERRYIEAEHEKDVASPQSQSQI